MTATQPYNIVLAGQFEVGKTTIFEHLRNNCSRKDTCHPWQTSFPPPLVEKASLLLLPAPESGKSGSTRLRAEMVP